MSDVEDVPQQLFDEAAQWNACLFYDGEEWKEVITWADAWIERLDNCPDELADISLGGRRKDSEARIALAKLATRGQFDIREVFRRALALLDAGHNPIQIIQNLYPLTYDDFVVGQFDFVLDIPKSFRDAIYTLDGAVDASDPDYTWTDLEGLPREEWLKRQIWKELTPLLQSDLRQE